MIAGLREHQQDLHNEGKRLDAEKKECFRKCEAYNKEADQISSKVVKLKVCIYITGKAGNGMQTSNFGYGLDLSGPQALQGFLRGSPLKILYNNTSRFSVPSINYTLYNAFLRYHSANIYMHTCMPPPLADGYLYFASIFLFKKPWPLIKWPLIGHGHQEASIVFSLHLLTMYCYYSVST